MIIMKYVCMRPYNTRVPSTNETCALIDLKIHHNINIKNIYKKKSYLFSTAFVIYCNYKCNEYDSPRNKLNDFELKKKDRMSFSILIIRLYTDYLQGFADFCSILIQLYTLNYSCIYTLILYSEHSKIYICFTIMRFLFFFSFVFLLSVNIFSIRNRAPNKNH